MRGYLTLATCCKKLLITQVTNFPFHQAHVQNNVPNPFNNKNIKKKKKHAQHNRSNLVAKSNLNMKA